MKSLPVLLASGLVAAGLAATVMAPYEAAAQNRSRIVIGMQLEPPHLDPTAGAAAAIDEVTYSNLFESLTRIDERGDVVPGLAERWEVSGDGLTYTFHLRGGVKYHDGTAFDSADVKFALDRARGDGSVNAQKGYFAPIETVETPDPLTVKVNLARPDGQFLFNMGSNDAAIVAPESADTNKQRPVGTGPFKFDRWVSGDRVVLVRNPEFRDPATPKLDEAVFRFISDPAAQLNAVRSGDVDAFPNLGATESLPILEADKNFVVKVGTTEGETILALNNGRKPFSDIRVRRALAHAVNRQDVINGALFGYGTPIGSHFAPHNAAYVDLTGISAYDPEKAKALLAEAGVTGFRPTLVLPPPSYARRGGEIVASQLRAVGIEPQIVNVEWAQWLERVFKNHDFDMSIVSHTEPMDIEIYARPDYYFGYDDPVMRALIRGLDFTTDEAERKELLRAAQERVANRFVNAFLFQLAKTGVADARLRGLWPNSPTQATDMTAVYWAE